MVDHHKSFVERNRTWLILIECDYHMGRWRLLKIALILGKRHAYQHKIKNKNHDTRSLIQDEHEYGRFCSKRLAEQHHKRASLSNRIGAIMIQD